MGSGSYIYNLLIIIIERNILVVDVCFDKMVYNQIDYFINTHGHISNSHLNYKTRDYFIFVIVVVMG